MTLLNTIPAEIRELADMAAADYDAFWFSLDDRDRELTNALTSSETLDTILEFDGVIWELAANDQTGQFEINEVGVKGELTVYADSELTGLDGEDLDAFIDTLRYELPGIDVVKGQSSSGRSGGEWIRDNRQVQKAWEIALSAV